MAVYTKRVTVVRCERCGYEWMPKDPEHLPSVCASLTCKSPYWNKPRQTRGAKPTRKPR
ncbi:hypothetical protein KF840_21715 [bacterium]|nr:hypothetical protein [bacterium]